MSTQRTSFLSRRIGLLMVFFSLFSSLSLIHCKTAPTLESGGVMVALQQQEDPLDTRLLAALETYIEKLAGSKPHVVRLQSTNNQAILDEASKQRAGLVLVLDAHKLATDMVSAEQHQKTEKDGFWLIAKDQGDWGNRLNSEGATVIYTSAATKLGRQYAIYEFLRRLGARFYHPEQEYLPSNAPETLRERAKTPTLVAQKDKDGALSDLYIGDFSSRSYTFHGSHPLEHLESFSDARHPIDEAARVNEWIIKNRGNRFRGAGRGIAPQEERDKRAKELEDLRTLLGFPRSAGITLHNEQQGSTKVIDRNSPTPVKEQIEKYVEAQLKAIPDANEFGIHFGPTEFTTTPDKETIDWINWAGAKALELRPDIRVMINNHTSGSQPMANYDDLGCPSGTNSNGRIDYYDLSFHTDKRFGVKVHTVMFYPIEGPALVYNQKTFSHKLCLMQKASKDGRPLEFFPEGSWWLSFDNPIPVYLPLYILTRGRDIELVRPLLKNRGGGTLESHRMFNSGHEWGYWQQDYAVGLWHWNADISLKDAIGEIMDPLCKPAEWKSGCAARTEAIDVMIKLMEHQKTYLMLRKDWRGLEGGLYAYLAGEDPADEIAAVTGFEFRPVKVSFREVSKWNAKQIKHFQDTDVLSLKEMEDAHAGFLKRLQDIRAQVPETGQPWLDETIDGIEINMLRARQTRQLYEAVILYRETQLANEEAIKKDPNAPQKDPQVESKPLLDEAQKTLQAAEAVVQRREKSYRYPAVQEYGGGLTPETAAPNGTTYPWRVHTKTHLMVYWKNRHEQVDALLSGKGEDPYALKITPTFAAPGEGLSLTWPKVNGLTATIKVGDQSIDPTKTTVDLGKDPGFWPITGQMNADGRDLDVKGGVVRSSLWAHTPAGKLNLTEPNNALAKSTLRTLLPILQWARIDGTTPMLVFGPDLSKDTQPLFSDIIAVPLKADAQGFSSDPITFAMPVPDPATGQRALSITLSEVTLRGDAQANTLQGKIEMQGQMSIDDLVNALIQLAGFDRKGALETLGSVLGFDPKAPPAGIPFKAEFPLEPNP
ncbi:MAG: hypothetical protein H6727_05735 [Myxococcales bacterium]|nr:hypothetical protein [Myxococcales bacterium]